MREEGAKTHPVRAVGAQALDLARAARVARLETRRARPRPSRARAEGGTSKGVSSVLSNARKAVLTAAARLIIGTRARFRSADGQTPPGCARALCLPSAGRGFQGRGTDESEEGDEGRDARRSACARAGWRRRRLRCCRRPLACPSCWPTRTTAGRCLAARGVPAAGAGAGARFLHHHPDRRGCSCSAPGRRRQSRRPGRRLRHRPSRRASRARTTARTSGRASAAGRGRRCRPRATEAEEERPAAAPSRMVLAGRLPSPGAAGRTAAAACCWC